MEKYDCYFDASLSPQKCKGAFYVFHGSAIFKLSVRNLGAKVSDMAEAETLHLLLNFIKETIEPGAKVCIFGDAQSLILAVKKGLKGCKRYKSVRNKFIKMSELYELSINFIPRKRNQHAHMLAKYGVQRVLQ